MIKLSLTKAKKRAWTQFSLFIRYRDSLKTVGNLQQCKCVSCTAIKNTLGIGCIQAGHFIAGRHNTVLFDEDLVHGQCYHCNVGLKGNWVEYEAAMIAMYGRDKVEEFKRKSKGHGEYVKYTVDDYLAKEAEYKQKIAELIDKRSVK